MRQRWLSSLIATLLLSSFIYGFEVREIPLTTCTDNGKCRLADGITTDGNLIIDKAGIRLPGTNRLVFKNSTPVLTESLSLEEEDILKRLEQSAVYSNNPMNRAFQDTSFAAHETTTTAPSFPRVTLSSHGKNVYASIYNVMAKYDINSDGTLSLIWEGMFDIDKQISGKPLFRNGTVWVAAGNTVSILSDTKDTPEIIKEISFPYPVKKIEFYQDYLVVLASHSLFMHPAYDLASMPSSPEINTEYGQTLINEEISLPDTDTYTDFAINAENLYLSSKDRIYMIDSIGSYDLTSFQDIDLNTIKDITPDLSIQLRDTGDTLVLDISLDSNISSDSNFTSISSIIAESVNNVPYLYVADNNGMAVLTPAPDGSWSQVSRYQGSGPSIGLEKYNNRIFLGDGYTTTELDVTIPSAPYKISTVANASTGSYTISGNQLFMAGPGVVKSYDLYTTKETEAYIYLPKIELNEPLFFQRSPGQRFQYLNPTTQEWDDIFTGTLISNNSASERNADIRIILSDTGAKPPQAIKAATFSVNDNADKDSGVLYSTIGASSNLTSNELQRIGDADPGHLAYIADVRDDIKLDPLPGVPTYIPEFIVDHKKASFTIPNIIQEFKWKPIYSKDYPDTGKTYLLVGKKLEYYYCGKDQTTCLPFPNQQLTSYLKVSNESGTLRFYRISPDGSTMEFDGYGFITSITARDDKKITFAYGRKNNDPKNPIDSVTITDAAGRQIILKDQYATGVAWFSRFKKAKSAAADITVSVKVNGNEKRIARYLISSTTSAWDKIKIDIYKDNILYRTDTYLPKEGKTSKDGFSLSSTATPGIIQFAFTQTSNLNANGKITYLPNGANTTPVYSTEIGVKSNIPKKSLTSDNCWTQGISNGCYFCDNELTPYRQISYPNCSFSEANAFKNKEGEDTTTVKTITYKEDGTVKRIIREFWSPWSFLLKRDTCDSTGQNCATDLFSYNEEGSILSHILPDGKGEFFQYNRSAVPIDDYINFYRNNLTAFKKTSNLLSNILTKPADTQKYKAECIDSIWTTGASQKCSSPWQLGYNDTRTTQYGYTNYNDVQWIQEPNWRYTKNTYDYEENTTRLNSVTPLTFSFLAGANAINADINNDGITNQKSGNLIKQAVYPDGNMKKSEETYWSYNYNSTIKMQGALKDGNITYARGFEYDSSNPWLQTKEFMIDHNDYTQQKFITSYSYDSLMRKSSETNAAGMSTVYSYDGMDRVTTTSFGCSSPSGSDCEYKRFYTYDAMNNLTDIQYEEWYEIKDDGTVQKQSTPAYIYQKTYYDGIGRAYLSCQADHELAADPEKAKTDPDARCIESGHDMFNNIVKKAEKGIVREVEYNYLDKPVKITENGILLESSVYDTMGRLRFLTNKYGKTAETRYDEWSRPYFVKDPFSQIMITVYGNTSYLFDKPIQEYTRDETAGVTTSQKNYEYDEFGRLRNQITASFIPGRTDLPASASSTAYVYDELGNIIKSEDSNGNMTQTYYDRFNRIKKEVRSVDGDVTSTTLTCYYGGNDPDMTECAPYLEYEKTYGETGRIIAVISIQNNTTTASRYWYDNLGRHIGTCTENPGQNNERCSYTLYNTGGKPVWQADEESGGETFAIADYDFNDFGNEKSTQYNAFGEPIKTIYKMTADGKGHLDSPESNIYNSDSVITVTTNYDSWGRVTGRENDRGGATLYEYYTSGSGNGMLKKETVYPAKEDNIPVAPYQEYMYTYDSKGDISSTTYNSDTYSLTVTEKRDDFGRIIEKSTSGPESTVPVTQTYAYNSRNLLKTASDNGITVARSYDSAGSVWQETTTVSGIAKTVQNYISSDNSVRHLVYPDGKTMIVTDQGGRLTEIAVDNTVLARYSYINGMISAITKGNGITETFTYDNWHNLINKKEAASSNPLTDYDYSYSRAWHLTGKKDKVADRTETYEYDSYYRLKTVDYGDGRADQYTRDGVHNLRESVENDQSVTWKVDGYNRLAEKTGVSQVTYLYDDRNNMIEENSPDHTITYRYDDLNRLISVTKDGTLIAEYNYDAFNRRILKTVAGAVTRYTYDNWNIVEEQGSQNGDIVYTMHYFGTGMDNHLAMESDGEYYYFNTDERGNVVGLSDSSGQVLERYKITAYGEVTILNPDFSIKETQTNSLSSFLWGGVYFDQETGLYWMRNRYYHIDMHRFVNQDPIGIWGDTNNLGNGFAYVAGMVIEHRDPTGLMPFGSSLPDNYNFNAHAFYAQMNISQAVSSVTFGGSFGGLAGIAISQVGQVIGLSNSLTAIAGFAVFHIYSVHETLNQINDVVGAFVAAAEGSLSNPITTVSFTDSANMEVSVTGENKDGKIERLIITIGPDGEVKEKRKEILDENGKVIEIWQYDEDKKKWVKISGYPSDPDNPDDRMQSFFQMQALKKMVRIGSKEPNVRIQEGKVPGVANNWFIGSGQGRGPRAITPDKSKHPFMGSGGSGPSLFGPSGGPSDDENGTPPFTSDGPRVPGSQFYRTPGYKGQLDPLMSIMKNKDPNGVLFFRNPFAKSFASHSFGSKAADLFYSDFNPGNIDIWE